MTHDQLRKALGELNSERDAEFHFQGSPPCHVPGAILIPEEGDEIVKVSDGKHVYLIDAERVAWVKIG